MATTANLVASEKLRDDHVKVAHGEAPPGASVVRSGLDKAAAPTLDLRLWSTTKGLPRGERLVFKIGSRQLKWNAEPNPAHRAVGRSVSKVNTCLEHFHDPETYTTASFCIFRCRYCHIEFDLHYRMVISDLVTTFAPQAVSILVGPLQRYSSKTECGKIFTFAIELRERSYFPLLILLVFIEFDQCLSDVSQCSFYEILESKSFCQIVVLQFSDPPTHLIGGVIRTTNHLHTDLRRGQTS